MSSKFVAALVSAALAVSATAAPAQSARALSLAGAHGAATAQARESDLGGRRSWTPIIIGLGVIGILVFVAIGLGKDHPIPGSP